MTNLPADTTDHLILRFVGYFSVLILVIGVAPLHFNHQGQKKSREASFNWSGKWTYKSPSGQLVFIVHIHKIGSQEYNGWHSMVDGRIHGGAIDSYSTDENGNIIPSLTNSVVVNSQILQFDFYSGYTGSNGKAQIEVVDSNHILFRVTDPPTHFDLSPLGNLVYQFNGYNSTTGGVKISTSGKLKQIIHINCFQLIKLPQ